MGAARDEPRALYTLSMKSSCSCSLYLKKTSGLLLEPHCFRMVERCFSMKPIALMVGVTMPARARAREESVAT